MFTAQELTDSAQPMIDAEGSQRYLDVPDWLPNINSTIQRSLAACNWQLANRKGSEEQLSELQETRIFQTNRLGGLALEGIVTQTGAAYTTPIWSIIGLYAEPSTYLPNALPFGNPANTIIRTDLTYMPGGSNERPVQRMTMEQVAIARDNMFMSGTEVLASGPMRTYGYYFAGKRTDGNIITGGRELFVTPLSRTQRVLIAMSYLRTPQAITAMTDNIDFPRSMMRTMADWLLQYMGIKEGDGTTLYSTSEKDAAQLFSFTV